MYLRPGSRDERRPVGGAAAQPGLEAGHAMRLFQEVGGADAVVAHQAEQGGAVAQPVALAQRVGLLGRDAEMADDVVADRQVHLAERRAGGVVQRVVEIEQPDRSVLLQRERIIVP